MSHFFRISIISIIFLQKGKLVLRSLLLEGCYFRRDRYIRKFATFNGSLLSELYGTCPIGKAPGKSRRRFKFFKPCLDMVNDMLWDDISGNLYSIRV